MATGTVKKANRVISASKQDTYTFFANDTRTVAVSPADLGIGPNSNIRILDVNCYFVEAPSSFAGDYFLFHSDWVAGTGVNLYLTKLTASQGTAKIKTNVLYEYA